MKKILSILFVLSVLFLFSGAAKAQQNSPDAPQDSETYYKSTEVDQKVVVKLKPRPEVNKSCKKHSGRISLRVYFNKSGQISSAKIVTPSSCDYFNQSSLKAVYKIEFEPAIKNNQPVSYTTIVEYNWNKY